MSYFSDSDHRRLEAAVFPDNCIVESHQISDASRGLRRVPVTKVWRTERVLGRGGFGEVHLQSQDNDKDAKRALKVIHTTGTKMSVAECQRELTAMIEFTKPKYKDAAVFVDFIGWFQNDNAMYLAMEYMPLGDLEHNVQEIENSIAETKSPLSEEEVQEITRQILEGLKIMHAEGFAHRDLKPQNVFVVQRHPQWWVKLGDFGLSKRRTDGTAYRTHAGTQQYMAPELFYYVQELDSNTSEYTSAIDLWSLGCIIHRLVTRAVPFPSLLSLRNYCKDPSKMPLNMPPSMDEAKKFVQELLLPNPAERPPASAALECNWLTSKNKPSILLNDMATNFAALNISRNEHGYNTASHMGLRSLDNLHLLKNVASDSSIKSPGTKPLPPPTANSILGPSNAKLQLNPKKENAPPLAQIEDEEYYVKGWSATSGIMSEEWSKLTIINTSGKTAPRLIRDLLDYDPRRLRQDGKNLLTDPATIYKAGGKLRSPRTLPQDCKHKLIRKDGQTFLPTIYETPSTASKYILASYCRRCLYHFDVIVDFTRRPGRGIPCDLSTPFPLHHFQHCQTQHRTAPDIERSEDKYDNYKEIHTFSCSAPSCPAVVDIRISSPRLNEELLSPILDTAKLFRRGKKAIEEQPERFLDIRPLNAQEALILIQCYLHDALTRGTAKNLRIYAQNKNFLRGFADECNALLEYLDFKSQFIYSDQLGEQKVWLLPALEPLSSDKFAVRSKRQFIEDVVFELSERIAAGSAQDVTGVPTPPVINREPATDDLYHVLGCLAYAKSSILITDMEEREQANAYYESLGAVNDFSGVLLAFAYWRQCSCDPKNSIYYRGCYETIAASPESTAFSE